MEQLIPDERDDAESDEASDTSSDDDEEDLIRTDELEREIEELALENTIFESYYKRNASEGLNDGEEDKRRHNRQRRRQTPTTLTIEQRVEVGNAEHAVAVHDIEETQRTSERLIDTLRAVLEETDIRIAELKKEAYEFKRDIVVGAENMRTGKTVAEKVVRYMEDKLRQRDAMTEKLRLKNSTLKSQIQKVESQLRQKDSMGDALHYIDFHQLQIENKQYVGRIEERNEELLRLKMTTGRTVQALNTFKNGLHRLQAESEWLSQEITARAETLKKITTDGAQVESEAAVERRAFDKLQRQMGGATGGNGSTVTAAHPNSSSTTAANLHSTTGHSGTRNAADKQEPPNIDDYIQQKKTLYELQQELKSWERKVEIAEMSAKRARAEARKQKLLDTTTQGAAPY